MRRARLLFLSRREQGMDRRIAKNLGTPACPKASARAIMEVIEPRLMLSVLPSGFVETEQLNGLASPTSMAIAPDGRVFVAQQNGIIRLIKNDVAVTQPVTTIPVDSSGERGILGIGVDPDFSSDNYLYVYYTASSPTSHNRISRFTLSGDLVALNTEFVLADLPSVGSGIY